MEEDNRDILRLLRDPGVPEKLEGLKRLIAQSASSAAACTRFARARSPSALSPGVAAHARTRPARARQ